MNQSSIAAKGLEEEQKQSERLCKTIERTFHESNFFQLHSSSCHLHCNELSDLNYFENKEDEQKQSWRSHIPANSELELLDRRSTPC